jgi:CBS domain-containing membrane protein
MKAWHGSLSTRAAVTTLALGSFAVLAVAGLAAMLFKETLLFPSLGPTAMLFFARPLPPELSVRTTILAHWVGIAAGYACLAVFGLTTAPSAIHSGVSGARVGAAALAVAITAGLLRLIRSPHAPAGATTLIVSLGLLTTGRQLTMMAASVVLVAALGWAVNLLVGVRVPVWPSWSRSVPNEVGETIATLPPWRPVPVPTAQPFAADGTPNPNGSRQVAIGRQGEHVDPAHNRTSTPNHS